MYSRLTIGSFRRDGLGSRMTNIINGLALADLTGAGFAFAWNDDVPRDSEFMSIRPAAAIFADGFMRRHYRPSLPEDRFLKLERPLLTRRELDAILADPARDGLLLPPHGHAMPVQGFARTLTPEDCARAFETIEFAPRIAALRREADARVRPGAVALHARRGDIVYGRNRFQLYQNKYAPLAVVKLLIESFAELGTPVLLFTDDDHTYDVLERSHGVDTVRRIRPDGCNDMDEIAFFEVFAMRRCRSIVSTNSAFAYLAALMAAIPCLQLMDVFHWLAARAHIRADLAANPGHYTAFDHARALHFFTGPLALEFAPAERSAVLEAAGRLDRGHPAYPATAALDHLAAGRPADADRVLGDYAEGLFALSGRTLLRLAEPSRLLDVDDVPDRIAAAATDATPYLLAWWARHLGGRGDKAAAAAAAARATVANPASLLLAGLAAASRMAAEGKDAAATEVFALVARHPRVPAFHCLAGDILAARREMEASRRHYRAALRLPRRIDDAAAASHVVRCANAGVRSAARDTIVRLLAANPGSDPLRRAFESIEAMAPAGAGPPRRGGPRP